MSEQEALLIRLGWREIGGRWVHPDDLYTFEDACSVAIEEARTMGKKPLAEIVKGAAARFDRRPEYRASAEARAELRDRRRQLEFVFDGGGE